jgi:hypothetical protein
MRRHAGLPQLTHEIAGVEAFISAQGHAFVAADLLGHNQSRVALSGAHGQRQPRFHQKPVPILHHGVAQIAQPGLAARALLVQPRIGIRRGRVGFVAALFPVKIHFAIPATRRSASVLGTKTLVTGPGLDQRPVHAEMLVRQVRLGPFQHALEEAFGDFFVQH